MLSHAEKGARRRMGARTPIKGYHVDTHQQNTASRSTTNTKKGH